MADHDRTIITLHGGLGISGPLARVDAEALGGRRARRALAFLALHHGEVIPRDTLADAVWDDELPPTWRSALRTALAGLRTALRTAGAEGFLTSGEGWDRLALTAPSGVDRDQAAALVHLAAGAAEPADAVALADSAATILRRPLLPDVEAEWCEPARRAATALRLRALDTLARAALTVGEPDRALAAASEAIEVDGLHEDAHRLAMEALVAAGRQSEAVRAYERLVDTLAGELGARPSPQTEALHAAIVADVRPAPAAPETSHALPQGLRPRDELPFVGRADERAWLGSQLAAPGPRLVVVRGEAGAGKSRLVREVAAATAGVRFGFARCDPEFRGSLEPILELARSVGVATDVVSHERDDVVAELARRIARQPGRVVLVVDDLHWAGPATVSFVRRLVRADTAATLHVVGTVRSDEPGTDSALDQLLVDLARDGLLAVDDIGGLRTDDVAELLDRLAGPARRTADVARVLRDQAGGNALFVGQAVRWLLQTGELVVDEDGAWSGDPSAAGSSASVRDLVIARVRQLGDTATEVLAAAAVVGFEFDPAVAAIAAGESIDVAVAAIDAAIRHGIVRSLDEPAGRCRFTHLLVHAAMAHRPTSIARAVIHHRIVTALTARRAPSMEVAHHAIEAAAVGDVAVAVDWSCRASAEATAALAYEDAIAIARRCLALRIDDRSRAQLSIAIGDAGLRADDSVEAHAAFVDAVAAAEAAGDADLLARAALGAARGHRDGSEWMPDPERRALLVRALERLEASNGDQVTRIEVLGQMALWTPDTAERQALAVRAVAAAESSPDGRAGTAAFAASRIALWSPADTARRIDFGRRASSGAVDRADVHAAAVMRFALLGDLIQSRRWAELSAERAALAASPTVRGSRRLRWQLRLWDVVDAVVAGRWDDGATGAEALANAALGEWDDHPHVDAVQAWGNQLAALRLLQGRVDEVVEPLAGWAAAHPEVAGFHVVAAWALATSGDHERARAALSAALRVDEPALGLPLDNTFPISILAVAETAALVPGVLDPAAALRTLEVAAGMSGQLVFQPGPHLVLGPADRALALLALLGGDRDRAEQHRAAAVSIAESELSPAWVARSGSMPGL